jgi:hypothetical protein
MSPAVLDMWSRILLRVRRAPGAEEQGAGRGAGEGGGDRGSGSADR